MIVEIKHVPFANQYRGLPQVDEDERRRITERVSDGICTTCIEVHAAGLPLGNHFHTEDEPFKGQGSGTLYLVPEGGDLANPETYNLPAEGWEVTVPAGAAHTFVFDGKPDENGVIATLVSVKGWQFQRGVNTFEAVIIDPKKVAA